MTGNRVFTEEELTEMGRRTLDVLLEAIDYGDKEKAKQLANRMYQEAKGMHDGFCFQLASLQSHIYETNGEADFYQAMRKTMDSYLGEKMQRYGKADFRGKVEIRAQALRQHLQPIKIEEDDEKVCMKMEPCGSGEILLKKGCYAPPCNFKIIQKPHEMTYGMTDFPIYCTHAPIIEQTWMDRCEDPAYVVYPAEKMATEGCWYCVYKDPKGIPEEVYRRVGREKPER